MKQSPVAHFGVVEMENGYVSKVVQNRQIFFVERCIDLIDIDSLNKHLVMIVPTFRFPS